MKTVFLAALLLPVLGVAQDRAADPFQLIPEARARSFVVLLHPGSLMQGMVAVELATVGPDPIGYSIAPLLHFTPHPISASTSYGNQLFSLGSGAGVILGVKRRLAPERVFSPAIAFELGASRMQIQSDTGPQFFYLRSQTFTAEALLFSAAAQLQGNVHFQSGLTFSFGAGLRSVVAPMWYRASRFPGSFSEVDRPLPLLWGIGPALRVGAGYAF